jgi:hypothetical protein
MTPSKIGVRFIPGGPLLARSRDHRKVYPAPHPAFGHLLPACGEKEKSRRRLMHKPQGQLHFRIRFCHEAETIAPSTPAPHPAFGHLLPACGEKEKSRRRLMDKPQGQLHFRRHFCHEVETIAPYAPAPHPAFGHLLPACGEKVKTSSASSQGGISAGQPYQERGRALHLGLQYRRPSMRRPISFDWYRCGYGGMVGCAALTPPYAGPWFGFVPLRFDRDDDVHAVD